LKPILLVLAGPNGAGKSTFYQAYLSRLDLPFLNADVLARALGLAPYEAANAIARLRDHRIGQRQGFILETVFSDPIGEKIGVFEHAARSGFEVRLVYIGLADPGLCQQRVLDRVRAGGHDVPPEKLSARYARSLANLERAIHRLPLVTLYDNGSYEYPHRFVAEFRHGALVRRNESFLPEWARPFVLGDKQTE